MRDAHGVITESVQYASRIQQSILPTSEIFAANFAQHYIAWEPRDIVGGDIYWARHTDEGTLVIVADCTGHGVPGAFITMIANGALQQVWSEFPSAEPALLLERLNQIVKRALQQEHTGTLGPADDGLEAAVCLFGFKKGQARYSGAGMPMMMSEGGEIVRLKPDRPNIGYRRTSMEQKFATRTISFAKGSRFYFRSDGLVDQVGGPRRRAFGNRRIQNSLQ